MASQPKPRRTLRNVDGRWPDRVSATASKESEEARERARDMRAHMSLPEVLLWKELRARRLLGLKFRRQHVLGPYFADFYCHELRLVVEVDGVSHAARREHDEDRDRWMHERGYTVLRLSASLVLDEMGRALKAIATEARRLQPSGRGVEEE